MLEMKPHSLECGLLEYLVSFPSTLKILINSNFQGHQKLKIFEARKSYGFSVRKILEMKFSCQ